MRPEVARMTLPRRKARALGAFAAVAAVAAFAVGSAVAANGEVSIDKLTFQPARVTIGVGDTVTWTVTNAVPEGHTVTSGKPDDDAVGDVFDSGLGLDENGQTFEFTFANAGTFPYFCKVHGAAMSGEVVVLEAGQSAAPAESAPPSAAPAASAAPSAGSVETVAPGASEGPGEGPHEAAQVPADRRLLAGGVLLVAIVIMFGAAAVWRRVNPA
jgi:plastocyanin